MGILNVTPDSFSDGGKFNSLSTALNQAKKIISAGADILDIGGESSRPGAREIPATEELRRTIPVIQAIRKFNKKIAISIDTTKSIVAEAAVKNGATYINDISGLTSDSRLAEIAAGNKVKLILMHRLGPSNYHAKESPLSGYYF
jgi:dihydropteroate synthase